MGSKRRSAIKIYLAISNREPRGLLVDLFCGGFAISEKFYKNGWEIKANDKNKYVIALLNQTINKGLDEAIVTQFVTREKFIDVTKSPDNYDDWYVGYLQCIWSFGNTQTKYLFGKDVEPIKHAGHKLVIDKDPTDLQRLISEMPQKYIDGILSLDNWHKRRIALSKVSKKLKTKILRLQQLQQLEQLEQLERLQQLQQLQRLERLEQLQQLQRLERLEQLQQLQRLERLETTAKDYSEVIIPREAVIYCDPPYANTVEYKEGDFDSKEFWEWCRKVSRNNHIYISEYNAPDDFIPILTSPRRSTLQGGNYKHTDQPDEKLFIYKEQGQKAIKL